MKDEFFEKLKTIMVDQLNDAFMKSKEYKLAVSKENSLYEELKNGLSEQQQKLLEEYFILSSETTAICGKIAYRQGMEDLAAMLFQNH